MVGAAEGGPHATIKIRPIVQRLKVRLLYTSQQIAHLAGPLGSPYAPPRAY
jgi:hypothetical protein